jgi:hypothetical protein
MRASTTVAITVVATPARIAVSSKGQAPAVEAKVARSVRRYGDKVDALFYHI